MSVDDVVQRRAGRIDRPPCTATVTATTATTDGVYVVPLDGDSRNPIGPCYGGDGAPIGTLVLLIFTAGGPWVAATNTLSTPGTAEGT